MSVDEFSVVDFQLYPNPTNQFVQLNTGSEIISQIELSDLNGSLIRKLNPLEAEFDFSDLSAGVYLVKVTNQKGEIGIQRLTKQ